MLRVDMLCYEDLSDEEKELVPNNGSGMKYASYIRVSNNGETIALESDAMEPEDCSFYRDLDWIPGIIAKAYELGRSEQQKK